MINEEPLFLSDPEWYYYDEDEMMYKLTDKATPEARASYTLFYDEVAHIEGDTITVA